MVDCLTTYASADVRGIDCGRYALRGLVGEGAMAWVYRAYDPLTHRQVAVKILKPSALERSADVARTRFLREAEAAGGLAHPHIVTIYDVTAEFIVMEFVEGTNLEDLLSQGPLGFEAMLSILHPLAAALDYAHQRGIVHRDVKPGNIMVSPHGRPTLTDFGVAHLGSAGITAAGEFLGSPSYTAPEQIDGGPVSPRADVFSLAAVVYEMATGTKAFAGPSVPAAVRSVLFSTPEPPSRRRPGLPASFDAVLRRGLAKNPEDRYASAGELAAAIDPSGFERALARISRGELWEPDPTAAAGASAPVAAARASQRTDDSETHDLGMGPRSVTDRGGLGRVPQWALVAVAGTALALAAGAMARAPQEMANPQPGSIADVRPVLRLETAPAGASVWVDDLLVGQSPLARLPLAPGPHALVVDRPGFATARLRFDPSSRARTTTVHFSLHARATSDLPVAGVTSGITSPQGEIETSHAATNVDVPRRQTGETPHYPPAAMDMGLQGTVVVEMTIATTGEVADLSITESAGDILDEAVLAAVRTWRYNPLLATSETGSLRWQVRQRFTL
jgi:serine/threonine-protein kinase